MRALLFAIGLGLMAGSFIFAGYACYRVIHQFNEAKHYYEQDLIKEAFER